MKYAEDGIGQQYENTRDPIQTCKTLQEIVQRLQSEQSSLVERYEWLEAMINHVPDFIYAKDREGRFLFANRAIVSNNGFRTVDDLIGLTDFDIHPSEAARDIAEVERRVMEEGRPDLGIEEERLTGEGWLMMSRVPLRDRSGKVIGIVGASRDISARKRDERLMKAQATLLQSVARGVELPDLLAQLKSLLQALLPTRRANVWLDTGLSTIARESEHEFAIPARDGTLHGLLVVGADATDDPALLEFLAGVAQTVGIAIDRHRDAERIAFLAEHDALTGLPNRASLDRRLQALLAATSHLPRGVAVAFVDLDHFKLVNDSLGHAAGDELGPAGLVSRVGGDEFIVVLTPTPIEFDQRLNDIREAIAMPLHLCGMELRVTSSIGFACSIEHGLTAAELFANADMALYRVKANGRNGVHLFSPALAEEGRHKLARIEELRRAIELDEFVLHYQPQRQMQTGKVIGVEALVRWQHPAKGLVAPGDFIPLAEETGLILAIGEMVLRKACAQARAWQNAGLAPIRIAVNMSARQFHEPALASQVAAALAAARLDPQWLEIEVTESLIMQDVEGAIERMQDLKELGITLSIDDFGTGYSSLSMLKRFPLSRLKIDRSFIADIPADPGDMAITSAILALAKLLGLEVVAEGVETADQADFLTQAGCDFLQGYLFSRPLPAHEMDAFLLGR
ncbi:EAL domain-containing protein (plasmid) [Rhizobium sp. BG6]|nr:EAL domain-containing protein [Rhizobium sp. BG6]